MNERVFVDLFVEDRAHEDFLGPLVERLAEEAGAESRTRVRSARGGHPRALAEFRLYQRLDASRAPGSLPDLVVVAIDANCSPYAEARSRIRNAAASRLCDRLITACPDPYIERWYLADLEAFRNVVGRGPAVVEPKCERRHCKNLLRSAVRRAGHPGSDGTDFAPELVRAFDLYRAGKADSSFGAFVGDFRAALRRRGEA